MTSAPPNGSTNRPHPSTPPMRHSIPLWFRVGLIVVFLIAAGWALYFAAAWMFKWWSGLEPLWGMILAAAVSLWIAARIVAAGVSRGARIRAQEQVRACKLRLYAQPLDSCSSRLRKVAQRGIGTPARRFPIHEFPLTAGANVLRHYAAACAGLAANQSLRADDVQSLMEALRKDLGHMNSALNAVQLQQILDPRSTG